MLTALKQKLAALTLVPAGGGCFEVAVDGEAVYSKLKTGAFPDEHAVLETVRARLKT